MYYEWLQNQLFVAILTAVYVTLGIFLIVPPTTVGIDVGIFEPVFAREGEHWLLRTGKGILGGNFLQQGYMLVAPPLVIEHEMNPGGYNWGPIIQLNPNLSDEHRDEHRQQVLKHEYEHYQQTAILTPLVFNGWYRLENWIHGYANNRFEVLAREAAKQDFTFSYISFVGGITFVKSSHNEWGTIQFDNNFGVLQFDSEFVIEYVSIFEIRFDNLFWNNQDKLILNFN